MLWNDLESGFYLLLFCQKEQSFKMPYLFVQKCLFKNKHFLLVILKMTNLATLNPCSDISKCFICQMNVFYSGLSINILLASIRLSLSYWGKWCYFKGYWKASNIQFSNSFKYCEFLFLPIILNCHFFELTVGFAPFRCKRAY